MIQKIKKSFAFIGRYGLYRFCREIPYRINNFYHESRFGVQTASMMTSDDLGTGGECLFYAALGYGAIFDVLKRIPIDPGKSVFVDYGSGQGRAVIAAASLPFKRVMGVEISDILVSDSKKNVEKMKHRKVKDVEIIQADASKYELPSDVNVIYFCNPFVGELLKTVITQIYESYKSHPRPMYILAMNNNDSIEAIIKDWGWMKKTFHTSYYPEISAAIFQTEN